jgi:predicted ATP-grasp superfamily ATP-dependent carboligase
MGTKVLVLDCWTNKALSVVQSLGEKGLTVHAVSHTRVSAPLYSRYVQKRFILKNPSKDPQEYKHQLTGLLKGEKYNCLIPLEVESIRIILDNKEDIEKQTSFCLPDRDAFERANDKWQVLQIAERVNIPIPKSYCPQTDQEVKTAIEDLGFPLVIKPRRSSGGRGLKTVYGSDDFRTHYPKIKRKYGSPILQERISAHGQAVAVGTLFKDSNPLLLFSYKRLREFPIDGGPSTLRESTNDPKIKALAEKLLKELDWHGVAMVEFKVDPRTNTPRLLEVNPRFWGSLQLAKVSGLNLPYAYYELCTNRKITKQDYKAGVRCRWLIPADIAHFLGNKNRFRMDPSFFHFFAKNTYYDQLSLKDMRATIAVIVCYFLNLFNPEIWRLGVFRR